MPYLLGLFHWGACRVSKLGVKSKRKSCKIDQIVWENACYTKFLVVCTYPLPIHCAEIFGALNGQWVPTRAFSHKRKALRKNFTYSMHFPYNPINFATFYFWMLPPIYSPCTRPSETILTNKASIERQINRPF